MNKIRSTKGITLISLVITIVVLIVLASVTIYLNLGNNGIFNNAKFAREKYQNSAEKEANELAQLDSYINIKEKHEILAEEVSFKPTDTNWNVYNVKEALDYLYSH